MCIMPGKNAKTQRQPVFFNYIFLEMDSMHKNLSAPGRGGGGGRVARGCRQQQGTRFFAVVASAQPSSPVCVGAVDNKRGERGKGGKGNEGIENKSGKWEQIWENRSKDVQEH